MSGGISKGKQGDFLALFDEIIKSKGNINSACRFIGIQSRLYRSLRDESFLSISTAKKIIAAHSKLK